MGKFNLGDEEQYNKACDVSLDLIKLKELGQHDKRLHNKFLDEFKEKWGFDNCLETLNTE